MQACISSHAAHFDFKAGYKLLFETMRKILIFFSIIAVLISLAGEDKKVFAAEPASEIGKQVPDFKLKDINGRDTAFYSYKGKVILLNFWATWCGPCKAEMPSLNNLYKSLKDKGFIVVGVSVDTSEKPVRTFINDNGITFPALMDSDREVSFDLFGVIGLPTSYLIDKNGIVVEKFMGEREWDSPSMKNKILKLLNGR